MNSLAVIVRYESQELVSGAKAYTAPCGELVAVKDESTNLREFFTVLKFHLVTCEDAECVRRCPK